jgi:hypothetical protein
MNDLFGIIHNRSNDQLAGPLETVAHQQFGYGTMVVVEIS